MIWTEFCADFSASSADAIAAFCFVEASVSMPFSKEEGDHGAADGPGDTRTLEPEIDCA